MADDRLSSLDTSFLEVETPAAHMHVGWAALFGVPEARPRPSFDQLLRAHRQSDGARAALPAALRRRSRSAPPTPSGWTTRSSRSSVTSTARRAADLSEVVDEVMSRRLSRDRPMWELWIADRLGDGRDRRRRQGPPLDGRWPGRGRAGDAAPGSDARAAGAGEPTAGVRLRHPGRSRCSPVGWRTARAACSRPRLLPVRAVRHPRQALRGPALALQASARARRRGAARCRPASVRATDVAAASPRDGAPAARRVEGDQVRARRVGQRRPARRGRWRQSASFLRETGMDPDAR